MFQVCQCRAEPGYPHAQDCPYPYFGNDEAGIQKWLIARAEVKQARRKTLAEKEREADFAQWAEGHGAKKMQKPTTI